jgi:hypothetical protein
MGKLIIRYHIGVEFIEGESKYYEARRYEIVDTILWMTVNNGYYCINTNAVKQITIQEVQIDPTTVENS